jgi:hypothetical protein
MTLGRPGAALVLLTAASLAAERWYAHGSTITAATAVADAGLKYNALLGMQRGRRDWGASVSSNNQRSTSTGEVSSAAYVAAWLAHPARPSRGPPGKLRRRQETPESPNSPHRPPEPGRPQPTPEYIESLHQAS